MFRSLLLSSLIAFAAACGGSKLSAQDTKPRSIVANDASCPVAVPGTSVTVEDANNGAALVFVTTGDVAELRKRVDAMAKMHNDHHGSMGALPDGKDEHAGHDMSGHAGHDMGSGSGHDMGGHDMSGHAGHAGGMIGVHSKATASEISGGVKLLFVSGGGEVVKLQGELRMHAQHMASGSCSMEKS